MPVKSRSPLDTATKRSKLQPRRQPYLANLGRGKDLAYRRLHGPGSWSTCENGKLKKFGTADDREVADNKRVFDFEGAMAVARKLLFPEDGAGTSASLVTIDGALIAYRANLLAHGSNEYNAQQPRVHLTPALLRKLVALVTEGELKHWRGKLIEKGMPPATFNRMASSLCAALTLVLPQRSHVWKAGLAKLPVPDEEVARNVILEDHEVLALIAASHRHNAALGLLVEVLALGPRPSQAIRLQCSDLDTTNPAKPLLRMPMSAKGGGRMRSAKKSTRYPTPITLSLAAKLKAAARGRAGNAPLLLRDNGQSWGPKNPHAQYRRDIQRIVASIGLDNTVVTAYSLRHSSVVRMLLKGVPLRITAAAHNSSASQLERHYSRFILDHSDSLTRSTLLEEPVDNVVALAARR